VVFFQYFWSDSAVGIDKMHNKVSSSNSLMHIEGHGLEALRQSGHCQWTKSATLVQ
jgi:hypothetical protein